MNEVQQSLEAIQNNGSWGQALLYGILVIIGCSLASAIFRSGLTFILGVVFAYYAFSLNSPDEALSKATIASQSLVSGVYQMGDCAAHRIRSAGELGTALRNGDVVDIARECNLLSKPQ